MITLKHEETGLEIQKKGSECFVSAVDERGNRHTIQQYLFDCEARECVEAIAAYLDFKRASQPNMPPVSNTDDWQNWPETPQTLPRGPFVVRGLYRCEGITGLASATNSGIFVRPMFKPPATLKFGECQMMQWKRIDW
jgi:hypothetical protein